VSGPVVRTIDMSPAATGGNRRRARIVHVIPSLGIGGLENVVARLTEQLHALADHVVVTPGGDGPMRRRFAEDVPVIAMAEQHQPDAWNALRMARLFRSLRPDIVHSRNWSCVDAIVGARLAGVPIVVHSEHGRDAMDPHGRNTRRRLGRRALGPLVTQFVTVSLDLGRWLVEDVGVPAHKVVSICNGVDTKRFAPGAREAARGALGIGAEGFVVGTVARLDPVKDQVGLIRAFNQVVSDPRALLVIGGDGAARPEIEGAISALGLEGRVRLLGERNDVPQVLAAFDVFVLCSVGEGISNTILEAMATGLPVIATRVGGNPELVVDEVTGLLVEPRQPDRLAAAMRRYLEDPELMARHGRAARERATSQFSLDRMVGAYADLYVRLVSGLGRR
jgi:sugar transferase (PEP-CTERM/EpsH1 system associated)